MSKRQSAPRSAPRSELKATNILGVPRLEELADGKQVVLWMNVEGHGRIKVESKAPGVYHACAVDPAAGQAAEAGAGAYCEQNTELLQLLYGQVVGASS